MQAMPGPRLPTFVARHGRTPSRELGQSRGLCSHGPLLHGMLDRRRSPFAATSSSPEPVSRKRMPRVRAEEGRAPRSRVREPVNICFVSSGLGTGGAELALLRLCEALLARSVEASAISLGDDGTVGPLLKQAGVPVLPLLLRSPGGWTRMRSTAKVFLARRFTRHRSRMDVSRQPRCTLSPCSVRPSDSYGVVRQSLMATRRAS